MVTMNFLYSQTLTQTIKGQVIDKISQSTIPGANIILVGTNPLIGTTSDENGYFKLTNVPIGRVSLTISFIGYMTVNLSNLNLSNGKELILTIEMEEQITTAKEVVITGNADKTKTINEMTTVSARTFSVEETQRFAGARNDVSRMATNFAGVSTANDAVNDIVIRGNSPGGLLWRMDEVDIPNPNHFGLAGNTGGPVSMLNNNLLANSDFMSAAFPARYGNALSGVFDLKLRNGNYEKHEFLGQIGFNGFELGAEGPIFKKTHSSYLINYRYSALGLMSKMGMEFGTGTAIPYYQDLCFKFNFPTNKFGRFTLFGLAGKNSINFLPSKADTTKDDKSLWETEYFDVLAESRTAVAGFTHTYLFNSTTYTKFILSASQIENIQTLDSIIPMTRTLFHYNDMNLKVSNLQANFYVNKKLNARNNVRIGVIAQNMFYTMIDSIYMGDLKRFITLYDEKDGTNLLQSYLEYQHKFNEKLTLNSGLFFQQLLLNNSQSFEPRVGLKWNFLPNQFLNIAYGLHSQTSSLIMYFNKTRLPNDEYIQTNKDLGFIKSHHYVIGYDYNISESFRIKAETYYQQLFNVPVRQNPSAYSVINNNSFNFSIADSLVNKGTGRNYGIELTIEKFLSKGFYGLFTLSLFDSKYQGSDNIERNTAFDGKYVVNCLAGKEFNLTKNPDTKRKKIISFDLKVSSAGGQRYTPVDVPQSMAKQITVYDETQAFQKQFNDYFRADFRFAYRIVGKKVSHEFVFDIQNFTNHKNPLYMKFNTKTGKEETVYQLGLFPMPQYRIIF